MTLLDELLASVDRMELALSMADMELQVALSSYNDYEGDNDYNVRMAALKCEQAYNAVVSAQADVDIYFESYNMPAR
jgi:hypothetical protein